MTKQKQRRAAIVLGAAALALCAVCAGLWTLPAAAPEIRRTPVAADAAADGNRLDLNTASAEELVCLPGIGPALAENILTRREELGGFRTKGDVLSVYGIGETVYETIEPYITY